MKTSILPILLAAFSFSIASIAVTVPQIGVKFEAATVKPSNTPEGELRRGACQGIDSKIQWTVPLGRCVFTRLTLKELLFDAYYAPLLNLFPTDQLIIGGPRWADQDYFNVEGKSEEPARTTQEELLGMLRYLLTERFQLQIHHENRQLTGYVLTQGKNGSRLVSTPEGQPCEGMHNEGRSGLRVVIGTCVQATNIARFLSGQLQAPVEDRTNLNGHYNFRLEWTPTEGAPGATVSEASPGGASIFTAIQELGLKLDAEKIPMDVLVIDAATRPHPD